jgi:hypothetical protein
MKKTEELLNDVHQILIQRGSVYGSAEKNHRRISDLWSGYLDNYFSPDQVAICMCLVKIARLSQTSDHEDSYTDLVGYALIAHKLVREMRGEENGI